MPVTRDQFDAWTSTPLMSSLRASPCNDKAPFPTLSSVVLVRPRRIDWSTPLGGKTSAERPPFRPQSNRQYVMEFVGNLLLSSFPNLTKGQVAAFVSGLLTSDSDLNTFKLHLRDFLVTLKVASVCFCAIYITAAVGRQHTFNLSSILMRRGCIFCGGLPNPIIGEARADPCKIV